jgi:hypothetical protein
MVQATLVSALIARGYPSLGQGLRARETVVWANDAGFGVSYLSNQTLALLCNDSVRLLINISVALSMKWA